MSKTRKLMPVLIAGLFLLATLSMFQLGRSAQASTLSETHAAAPAVLTGNEVSILPVKDNTLYEQVDGTLSNGAGQYLFAGTTSLGAIRRGLLAFDLTEALPPGAEVVSATLTLYMSRTIAGDQPIELRRVLADWGEGDSQAGGEEGGGAPAGMGDATWLHTFYDSQFWTTAGGDFASVASAVTTVGAVGSYEWSSDQMLDDVEGWLDNPATNFGWLLLGNEAASTTAKRFNTREHIDTATRPVLTIVYSLPYSTTLSPTAANMNGVPGTDVTYTLLLSNTGTLSDSYDLTPAGNIWPVAVSPASVSLAAGSGTEITVTVTIPAAVDPNAGISDTVTVTATSNSAPQVMASSQLTTTAVWQSQLFLPLITRP